MHNHYIQVAVNGLSAHTGGGLTYLAEQIRGLAGLGGEKLTFIVFASGALAHACAGLPNVEVRRVPSLPLLLRIPFEQLILPYLTRKADVIYCPGNFAMFLTKRPQVVTFQNPNHFGSAARRVRRNYYGPLLRMRKTIESWGARMSIRRATVSFAISQSLRATMVEDVGERESMKLLLSATPELPARSEDASAGDGYALAVANDYPHKDWDGLIACFTSRRDLPRLILVGAPRGPVRGRRLQRLIDDSENPGGVSLRGQIADRELVASLYSGADVYVAHSRLEAFPLTPYEALAFGVPVVASDIPPHREVGGDVLRYYPVDDPDALSRLLLEGSGDAGSPPIDRSWHDNAVELAQVLRAAAS